MGLDIPRGSFCLIEGKENWNFWLQKVFLFSFFLLLESYFLLISSWKLIICSLFLKCFWLPFSQQKQRSNVWSGFSGSKLLISLFITHLQYEVWQLRFTFVIDKWTALQIWQSHVRLFDDFGWRRRFSSKKWHAVCQQKTKVRCQDGHCWTNDNWREGKNFIFHFLEGSFNFLNGIWNGKSILLKLKKSYFEAKGQQFFIVLDLIF